MGGSFKKILGTSLPLQGFVTGKKSFSESLKTDGGGIEQGINRGILKAFGDGGGSGYYSPPKSKPMDMSSMFAQQNQMLANMKSQSAANIARQQKSNAQLATSAPRFQSAPPLAENKIGDITAPADLPVDMYQPSSQQIAMNNFQMPDLSNIRFGGV